MFLPRVSTTIFAQSCFSYRLRSNALSRNAPGPPSFSGIDGTNQFRPRNVPEYYHPWTDSVCEKGRVSWNEFDNCSESSRVRLFTYKVLCLLSDNNQIWEFQTARPRLYRRRFLQVNTKYSLESSWRDLQDVHTFAPLRPQYFSKIVSSFFVFPGKFSKNRYFKTLFIESRAAFDELFSEFRRIL